MSHSLSRGRAAPFAALRVALVMGLVVTTLGACRDDDEPTPGEPPVARDVSLETLEDTPLELELPASGNGTLTFTIVDAPDHGTLGVIRANGAVTYTPAADFHGADALVFRVTDSKGASAQGTVSLTVIPVNDAPTLTSVPDQRITRDSSTGELPFTVDDVDTGLEGLTVSATSSNTDLVPNDSTHLVLGGAGSSRTLDVLPVAGASGSTTITLSVSDGSETRSTTFTLEVTLPASLYWMTASNSLWRADVNGANAVELRTGISGASSVATDPVDRTIFYNRDAAIVRADSDGANPVDVVANGGFPSGLAIDSTNRKLYWSDFNGSRVMRAELDGSNPMQVVGGINSPSALAFDVPKGKVYLITYNNTRLVRFDMDGTNVETVATGLGGLGVGLAVDSSGGKVYFSTRGPDISVANLDGSNVTPLVTNQTTVHGIAIDVTAGRLYWADWLATRLRSANLADGGDIQDVNAGSARNLGLAWMPAP
ncbi:Ig-like domain-containing protein [Myxococcus sp. K38C18041901]|uniref:Ig-like domain-containing protein n=1 Tax=Myxococcus guangdongensis TaxID=2906760 RepID=UPI0020A80BA6|nr:Ig-like domain-containing protein [Myxococcus guangdongensis]MCP3063693.1 Ig-like domain-containing protein [Myxococcus guangdongensis]